MSADGSRRVDGVFESGNERLLLDSIDLDDAPRRSCLSRVVPLLCRCLVRKSPHVHHHDGRPADSQYGKIERNPLHAPERPGSGVAMLPSAPPRRDDASAARAAEAFEDPAPLPPAPPPRAAAPAASSQMMAEDEEDENEPEEDYVVGGYHPVSVGDVYDERYKVLHKLGWGVYSTVWCCWDAQHEREVALKIQKAAPEYTNAAVNEINILQHIQRAAADLQRESDVVLLLEHFYVAGPHGNHVCMVFELLGETLLHAIQERGVLQVDEVRGIAACLLKCLAFVHDDVGVIHTDIKPENVLLEPARAGAAYRDRVKLVDLGTAFYVDRQSARDIQTREYRCPEGILGILPFTPAADLWSVGCLVFELLTGETLFDPQSPRAGEAFSKDESHLAQAVELLGAIPPHVARRGTRNARAWFAGDGAQLCNIAIAPPLQGVDALARVLEENFGFAKDEARDISAFLKRLLEYEPAKRATAKEALELPWLAGLQGTAATTL